MKFLYSNYNKIKFILDSVRKLYNIWYDKRRVKAIKKFISDISGEKVLDVGSGKGIFNGLLRELGFKTIFAIDYDRKMLQANDAEKKLVLNLEKNLPFPNNYFDCCFAIEIIEHLENRKNFLNEIYRVLKKKGYLILTTPNKDSLISKFDILIGRFISDGKWNGHNLEHKYVYGFKEIIETVREANFKIIKISSFYFFYGLPILTKSSLGMCTWILAKK